MKRINAFLLALVMLCSMLVMLPAASAAPVASGAKSIKILIVGDRYADDAAVYLYDVFHAAGYDNVRVGWSGTSAQLAFTPRDYLAAAEGDKSVRYTKYDNNNFPKIWSSKKFSEMLTDEVWDVVVLTCGSPGPTDKQSGEEISSLIAVIREGCTNPDVQFGWQMPWMPKESIANEKTFSDAAEHLKSVILPKVDFVIPSGTAIANVATSYIGSDFYGSTEKFLTHRVGTLTLAHIWYCALTGKTLDDLLYKNSYGQGVDASEVCAIMEAVNNAYKDPYNITKSTYTAKLPVFKLIVDGKEVAGGITPGKRNTINATEGRYRVFERWEVVRGSAKFDDLTAKTTYVTTSASQDVEIRGVYHEKKAREQYSGDTGLRVGYSRVDITPSMPAPLAGYGKTMERMSQGRLRPYDGTYLTVIAFSNDGKDVAYACTVDFIYAGTYYMWRAKEDVSKRTGVPVEKISISGTHSHSEPDTGDPESLPGIDWHLHKTAWTPDSDNGGKEYYAEFIDGFTRAIQEATADLSPVTRAKGSNTKVIGQCFVRHWRYNNGMMGGTNATLETASACGFARDSDQDLIILRFYRNAPKKDVVMVNFTAHATLASTGTTKYGVEGKPYISADFPGYMRTYVEEQDGYCHVAFFQGALGCTAASSNMIGVARTYQPSERADVKGAVLGEYALDAMEKMPTINVGKVQSMRVTHVGFETGYSGITRPMEYDTITMGTDAAICFNGCEMFDVNAISPFKITFVCSCSQSAEYIPTFETFRWDIINGETGPVAYEAKAAQCNVVPGTGEDLASGIIGSLNKLYKTAGR